MDSTGVPPGWQNVAMDEDLLDVVDASDRVVGVATRRDVHARGLLHRAVHILVFNGAGEILLQKRSMQKDRHPGEWDSSASGHVDAGETYGSAARRELREELGIGVGAADLAEIGRIEAGDETEQEFVRVYRLVSEGPFSPDPAEISEIRFESPAAVGSWIARAAREFSPSFLTIWNRYGGAGPARAGPARGTRRNADSSAGSSPFRWRR